MIVLFNDLELQWALKNATDLDRRLFGDQAWGYEVMSHEVMDTSRTYIADITESEKAMNVDNERDDNQPNVQSLEMYDSQRLIMRGYAGIWIGDGKAEIMTVGVDNNYRRQGIAGRMLDWLINYARINDVGRISLEVLADNQTAQQLYHSRGFEDIGLLSNYYASQGKDCIKMVLDLKEHIMGFSAKGIRMEQQ
ncbi:Acetyltransferase (GNAT) family protein [Bifidobacterium commune]|uniref:Acetyltransferase (GNAT) family protein n=2 Tax=Bifidobacterium commune TaxID=1505727 RepID=A0A1C4H1W6_9BIFI|nr:Acetyltransferase (GNAT) family protein [Bifidobacterium commune]